MNTCSLCSLTEHCKRIVTFSLYFLTMIVRHVKVKFEVIHWLIGNN